jgi:hypothetical protein
VEVKTFIVDVNLVPRELKVVFRDSSKTRPPHYVKFSIRIIAVCANYTSINAIYQTRSFRRYWSVR